MNDDGHLYFIVIIFVIKYEDLPNMVFYLCTICLQKYIYMNVKIFTMVYFYNPIF